MKCVCVPPCGGAEGPKNLAEVPKTGRRAPKLGWRPSLGVFGPHTDQDYAGRRPALVESYII